jgi:putative transposase
LHDVSSFAEVPKGTVRFMFGDESGFGLITSIAACWAEMGIRPTVPCHHVRQFRYLYGAVSPQDGSSFFISAEKCNTDFMNFYLKGLSEAYPDDYIFLVLDNAAWHKSKEMVIPENIKLAFIPPYTPEMNPIEQMWKEFKKYFANRRVPDLKGYSRKKG